MKYSLVFIAIALCLLVSASVVHASADSWAVSLCAGSPDPGHNEGVYGVMGVMPDATDGFDSAYEFTMETPPGLLEYPDTTKWAQLVFPGSTTTWSINVMSPSPCTAYPNQEKVWPFRVGSLYNAPLDGTRLYFRTIENYLPPAATGGLRYYLRLVDGKGAAISKPDWAGGGEWQNGQKIELAMPATADTEFGICILPDLQLPEAASPNDLYSLGYQFEFIQGAVPEPGSLLALGTGLLGLAGLASRKRR